MDDGSCDHSDARMIQAAFTAGAEACVLLLRSHPHLLHPLVVSLLREAHHLSHDQILRIFSLAVFGHEPPQAVEHLRQLKPAGYCGHVFVDGELSYKCVLVRPSHAAAQTPTNQLAHVIKCHVQVLRLRR